MRKVLNLLFLALAVTLILPSCVSKKKWTELLNDKDALNQTLSETQQKVKMLEGQMADLEAVKTKLEDQLSTATSEREKLGKELTAIKNDLQAKSDELAAASKQAEVASAENQMMKEKITSAFAPYSGSGLSLTEKGGRVYVSLNEPITFRSGSTRLSKSARANVASLAEILKNNPSLTILVEGHSDNAKMNPGVAMDNFDLSFQRAMSVVSRLKRNGVSPAQLSVVGRGDSMPAVTVDPDSPETRAQNRRVEFLILPKNAELYNLNKV